MCLYKQKRARVPAKIKFGDNQSHDLTSDPSDQSPGEAEREGSFDEFVEPRARAKRNRMEESSAAAKNIDQSLIGKLFSNSLVWSFFFFFSCLGVYGSRLNYFLNGFM